MRALRRCTKTFAVRLTGGHGAPARLILAAAIFVALLLPALSSSAADPVAGFREANRLYEQQNYGEAARAYEKLIEDGVSAPAVWFNLGNAWFKAGNTGRAIAAYRRAQMLAPRDPDILANLQFARDQLPQGSAPKTPWWREWIHRFTVNEWTAAAMAAFWSLFLLLALGQWRPAWRRLSRVYAAVCAAAVALTATGCALAARQQLFTKSSIVVAEEAVVRLGPFEESRSAYTARNGTELTVLDQREEWVQVLHPEHGAGWVAAGQVLLLP